MTMPEDGPWKFGEFLKYVLDPTSVPQEQPPEELADGMQKAAEHYFLPKRSQRIQARLEQLERLARGRLTGGKNKVGLKFYIRAAKLAAVKSGNLNYSQIEIATSVDRMLADRKTNFSKVCPESWQKHNPPRLFADVFSLPKHPLLKLAKPYISKTEV
jgi:hypothetical protein